ncbi:MAG: hypothetical protein WBA25_09480, partial [Jannaschia sp.]
MTVPGPPDRINACPCDYCRRIGARWGYYEAKTVTVEGPTASYRRADRIIAFYRCTECGVLTHWGDPDGRIPKVGVHMEN